MCKFCVTHADGGKWYEVAQNYAAKMYKYQKEEARKKRADFIEKKRGEVAKLVENGKVIENGNGWYVDESGEFHALPGAPIDLDIMLADLVQDVIDASYVGAENLPFVRQKAKSFMDKYHTMQVITYEEAKHLIEMTWPIGLMECICRRERRGMYNDPAAHTCFALGVGLYKYERWPETFRGMAFLSVKEAKERLEYLHKKGCVHALTTFYTPYIGGLCSCEYPTCLGIRGRVDYDVEGIFYKGHAVAIPVMENCTGCGECVQFCQFGALSVSRSRNKLTVNMQKCFGCAQCAEHCPNSAIRMQDRSKAAGLSDSW
jgi:ferredoxin